jgi:hypothetical protein
VLAELTEPVAAEVERGRQQHETIDARLGAARTAAACTQHAPTRSDERHRRAGRGAIAAAVWSSMRVTVSVSNSGSLKSGHAHPIPRAASSAANRCAVDDAGDEAKPWR